MDNQGKDVMQKFVAESQSQACNTEVSKQDVAVETTEIGGLQSFLVWQSPLASVSW